MLRSKLRLSALKEEAIRHGLKPDSYNSPVRPFPRPACFVSFAQLLATHVTDVIGHGFACGGCGRCALTRRPYIRARGRCVDDGICHKQLIRNELLRWPRSRIEKLYNRPKQRPYLRRGCSAKENTRRPLGMRAPSPVGCYACPRVSLLCNLEYRLYKRSPICECCISKCNVFRIGQRLLPTSEGVWPEY